jgi:hypothetical protein
VLNTTTWRMLLHWAGRLSIFGVLTVMPWFIHPGWKALFFAAIPYGPIRDARPWIRVQGLGRSTYYRVSLWFFIKPCS